MLVGREMTYANFSDSIILRVRHTMKAIAPRFWGTVAAAACCFGICNGNHSYAMPYGSATVLAAKINWTISTSQNPNDTTGTKKSLDAAISEVIYTIDENLDSSSTSASIVIPNISSATTSHLPSEGSQAFNACQSKGGQCQPGASGVECRTCGTIDGRASTSTLGMLTCMGLFFAWKLWHRFGY
jgi:hypothetical protein